MNVRQNKCDILSWSASRTNRITQHGRAWIDI